MYMDGMGLLFMGGFFPFMYNAPILSQFFPTVMTEFVVNNVVGILSRQSLF